MLAVEIQIDGGDDAIDAALVSIWNWLAQRDLKPLSYRYVFSSRRVVFRVGFSGSTEAASFAHRFGGKIVSVKDLSSPDPVAWDTINAA